MADANRDGATPCLPLSFGAVTEKNIEQLKARRGRGQGGVVHEVARAAVAAASQQRRRTR